METATSAAAITAVQQPASDAEPAPANAGGFTTIADDRLQGVAAIRDFIDRDMTLREMRSRLEKRFYPCWKEGRHYVASKAALLKHWREKAETAAGPPQPVERPLQHKSTRRGHLGRRAA